MQLSQDDVNAPQRVNALRIFWLRLKEHPLSRVGPGLITGVADDDPSGIATYSQAGAQFGLNMLWTMPLAFPLMAAIQSMCARIGRVTGKGLAANIKATFPPIVLQAVVLLLLIANTLNIAADVAAMGEVAELVSGFDRHLMTAFFVFGTSAAAGVCPLSPLRLLLEVVDTLTVGLRRSPVHGSRSLGSSGATHGLARFHAECRCRGRRRLRHDHQSLPFLLAGFRRGRGHAGKTRLRAAHSRCACSRPGTPPHPLGHLERHALLRPYRLLHHPGDRSDA